MQSKAGSLNNLRISVIITAGGTGTRFGSDLPKQFIELSGIPIIIRSILKFDEIECIDTIVIAINHEFKNLFQEMINKFSFNKNLIITHGGKERQDSVYNSLVLESVRNSDLVLVHDAVRPLVSRELILGIIEKANTDGAVIPLLSIKDTIKVKSSDKITDTIDRNLLGAAQTPQGFRTDLLIKAYTLASVSGFKSTDDSSLCEFAGISVSFVEGEESNIKITRKSDLDLAEFVLLSEKKKKQ